MNSPLNLPSTSITNSGNARTPGTMEYEVFVSDPIPFAEVEKARQTVTNACTSRYPPPSFSVT